VSGRWSMETRDEEVRRVMEREVGDEETLLCSSLKFHPSASSC
jgi:hypothetical protein